jgi:putative transposase
MNYLTKSFKYRIYPTEEQEQFFNQNIGNSRFVFNHIKNNYEYLKSELKKLGYDFSKESDNKFYPNRLLFNNLLNTLKSNYDFLKLSESSSLQCSYDNLISSYNNFFRKLDNGEIAQMKAKFLNKLKGKPMTDKERKKFNTIGAPKFQSKNSNNQSFKIKFNNNNIKIIDDNLKIPKVSDPIKIKYHRKCIGKILSVTIKKSTNKWYASINVKNSSVSPFKLTDNILGIDPGIKNPINTSDNFKLDKINFKNLDDKIVKLHKKLSNQVLNSHNYLKTKAKLQIIHDKKRNKIMDILHKFTYNTVKEYDEIYFGDLNIQWLLSNHKIARTVSDQHLGEIKRQLSYKCDWYTKKFKEVSEKLTTQTCNNCGYIFKKASDLKIRSWLCPECGIIHDRDINAAKNIKTVGLAKMACGTTNIS